jgi:hypothetical protein
VFAVSPWLVFIMKTCCVLCEARTEAEEIVEHRALFYNLDVIFCEVGRQAEESVEYRAWSMTVNVMYRLLEVIVCTTAPPPPLAVCRWYPLSVCYQYTGQCRIVCVKAVGYFRERIH